MHHSDPHKLSSAVRQYLDTKRVEGYSLNTLTTYAGILARVTTHLGDPPLEDVDLLALRSFLSQHQDRKPATLGLYVRVIRSCFRWLHEEGFVARNASAKLKEPKQAERIPKALTTEEVELLRDSCRTTRDRALVEVFFATGGRLSEIHALDRSSVDWDRRAVTVLGKGRKEREVYFGARAAIWLRRYLNERTDDHPALFVTARAELDEDLGRPAFRRLARSTIRERMKHIAESCGLRERVSPHVLRHTLATTLLNQGAPLAVVQSLLGHSKPQTTMIYVSLSGAQRKRDYERYFVQ